MRKLVAVLMLMLVPVLAFGGTVSVDTTGLTESQIKELQAQRDKMKSPEGQVKGLSEAVRKETEAWAGLGANIGTAMVSAAKELGMAANEFSQTGLGKIVTVMLVYKIMGKAILGVIVGTAILIFGFSMIIWLLTTKRFGDTKYDYKPMLWGLWQRKVITEYKTEEGEVAGKLVASGVLLIITLIVGLNCIF